MVVVVVREMDNASYISTRPAIGGLEYVNYTPPKYKNPKIMEGGGVSIRCQACGESAGKVLICSQCKSGYYCSAECQKKDYKAHKAAVCSAWDPKGRGQVDNPWFSHTTDTSRPNDEMCGGKDDELLKAAELGDCEALTKCIERGALLSVPRNPQGDGALHLAVVSGKVDAVRLLLDAGAYINVTDWRGATPMYYACSHPGHERVLEENPETRAEMIAFLVSRGADTMRQSGFSGKRPYEALREKDHVRLITDDPLHEKFSKVRQLINSRDAPLSAKRLVDLMWRSQTAAWLIQFNRGNMMQNFRPHPQLLDAKTPEAVEVLFKDCQARHERWWRGLEKE